MNTLILNICSRQFAVAIFTLLTGFSFFVSPVNSLAQDFPDEPSDERELQLDDGPDFNQGREKRGPQHMGERAKQNGFQGRGEQIRKFGPREFGRMAMRGRGMETIANYLEAVQDPYKATGMAILGLRKHYKRQGKSQELLTLVEEQLKTAKDQKMRNILLFSLRQLHEEAQNSEKLVEINKQIIRENAVGK